MRLGEAFCEYISRYPAEDHWTPFSRGGKTNTRDAALLCPRHHARAHDPAFTHALEPDGSVTFHRRT